MDSGWNCLYPSSVTQFILCDRSANYFLDWRYPIDLFTCPLFQKEKVKT